MFPIRDSLNLGKFPLVNISLIIVNIYVFFQELISPNLDQLVVNYALIPQQVDFSKIETNTIYHIAIFTCWFFTYSFKHVVFVGFR